MLRNRNQTRYRTGGRPAQTDSAEVRAEQSKDKQQTQRMKPAELNSPNRQTSRTKNPVQRFRRASAFVSAENSGVSAEQHKAAAEQRDSAAEQREAAVKKRRAAEALKERIKRVRTEAEREQTQGAEKTSIKSHTHRSDMALRWMTSMLLVLVVAAGAALYTRKMDKNTYYEVAAETQYQVITASCNIRAGAGTGYSVVGNASQGDRLASAGQAVLNASGTKWYEVTLSDGQTGWVSESVVSEI